MSNEITKKDWELFQEKLGAWQENYMQKLELEYVNLLCDTSKRPSKKFWELHDKIKEDKKSFGVQVGMRKSETVYVIKMLIADNVITIDDLEEFSDELKEELKLWIK